MSELGTTRRFSPLHEAIATAPAAAEEETLRGWRERGTFEAVQRAREGARAFVFWEGPPTANGRPGIHHVLARTIKDVVCRWETMQGRRVVRKAGWDTHGLPVELEVEKKLGISGKPEIERFGVARFNEECRKSVWTYRKEWEELSERIGYWLDYAHPYVTYESSYVESVWHLLRRFFDAGLVYHGRRVLPYCGRCGTGLSSHELGQPGVYRDVMDPSVVVRFRLVRGTAPGPEEALPESFLAWTTTPWTLPSNFALAVHPEVDYVRARIVHKLAGGSEFAEVVWIAEARAEAVLPKGFEVLERRKGRELAGRAYEPLFGADVAADLLPDLPPGALLSAPHRVLTAAFVTTEDGTGIVHQAPYGVDDWEVARAHRIPTVLGPGNDGRFVRAVHRPGARVPRSDLGSGQPLPDSDAVVAAGTWFKDADAPIVLDLKERHLLFRNAHEGHSYPHCWRCDTPLFYFPSPAWYIRTTSYKDRMIEHNRHIRWIPPEVGDKRFGEWLENNVDWNISRDRYWGTPLPFWVCERDAAHVRAVGGVAELRALAGELPAGFDLHKPSVDEVAFRCDRCAGTMRRTRAVLDCWFDSGAMPYAQYGWPHAPGSEAMLRDQFPAHFIAEGLDQTRGWFYTLHAIGAFVTSQRDLGLPDAPAYATCAVNGLVLDKDGVKMSKRLGNVVDPWKAIADHGADAVRWYLLSSGAPWLPKRFDAGGLLEVRRRFLGTLVNSYRFFAEYARIDGFDPADPRIPAVRSRPEIDRWLASRTQTVTREVEARMQAYDLAGVCRALEVFVVDELSNWYIRRNRRRFWRNETGDDKLAAFATLHAALERAALLLAPFAPFLAEMLWERLGEPRGSVHAQLAPPVAEPEIDPDLEASMRVVARVVEMGRALRERARLRVRQPLRALHVRTSDERSLQLLRTGFAAEQILDELNIRSFGSLASDDGKLCRLRAKANFRALGKRLGSRTKAAAAAIESLPGAEIARLRGGSSILLRVEGEELGIGPEEVQVLVETDADFDVETDGRYVVWIDTALDDELIGEWLAREVVNRVNALRKEAGLAVDDRIRLVLDPGDDAALARAIREHRTTIAAETLALSLEQAVATPAHAAHGRFEIDESRNLGVALVRA